MNLLDAVLIVVLPTAAVVLMRLVSRIRDNGVWVLSGEERSLMLRRFIGKGISLRRTVDFQAVVLRLALISRLNLPLASALKAASESESGRTARVLMEISRLLNQGIPISKALETSLPGCPPQFTATLRRAEACGQLTEALAQEERALAAAVDLRLRSTAHTQHAIKYSLLMIVFTTAMVSWSVIFIIPKFQKIFADFDATLPPITIMLNNIAYWFVRFGWTLLPVGVLAALIVLFVLVRQRAGTEVGIITRMVAGIRWANPITRTLDYGLGMAKAVRSIKLSIRAGSPNTFSDSLPSVVSASNHLRHRLTVFTRSIEVGVSPPQAAQQAKLGDVFVSALRMIERGVEPDKVLDHAAAYYEAIAFRWWRAMAALSGPLMTLAMAVLVGFIALALFMPLVTLINATAESI